MDGCGEGEQMMRRVVKSMFRGIKRFLRNDGLDVIGYVVVIIAVAVLVRWVSSLMGEW